MATVKWRKPQDFSGQSSIDNPSGPRSSGRELSHVEFPCTECHQKIKGNKGYYVEHEITFTNRYGLPETRLCNGSNNKIKAELRTLTLHGECDNCGTNFDFKLTEEFPGGLKQEGGVMEVPCVVCHGKTTATCEHCGGALTKSDDGTWSHDITGKNECPFSGVQDDSLDDDLDDEFFEAAPKGPQEASPLAGTEQTAPLNMVLVDDGHEIPEYDDTPTPTSTENSSEDALAQDQEV